MATADESTAEGKSAFIRWKRWSPFIVAGVIVVITIGVDRRLKHAPLVVVPSDGASMVISTSDLGATWSGLIKTSTWGRIGADSPDPLHEPLVALRKQLGIRLSPERWNTWLGPQAIVVRRPEGWALITQPGVLMRMVTWIHGRTTEPISGGRFEYRGFVYRWDAAQFQVASTLDVLEGLDGIDTDAIPLPDAKDAARIALPNQRNLTMTLYARQGLPAKGRITLETLPAKGLTTLEQIQEKRHGLIEISGARPIDWMPFLVELLPDWPTMIRIREGFDELTEMDLASAGTHSTWVLDALDGDPHHAVPLFTLALTNVRLASIKEPSHPLREVYRADTLEGWREPWLGHRYEQVMAADETVILLTNGAEEMRENVGRWTIGEPANRDVRAVVRVPELLRALRYSITRAAELDAIQGRDEQDVDELLTALDGRVKYLGRVDLEGDVAGDQVVFEGYLDAPDE